MGEVYRARDTKLGRDVAITSDYSLPRLSRDGERLALVSRGDIWVHDIPRGASTRLTFDGSNNSYVGWMPDGERVAFSSTAKHAVIWRAADGSGASGELVSRKPDPLFDAVSPDGRFLAFHEHRPATNADLWILPIDSASEPRSFLATPFLEHGMAFSPDGRAAVYVSNESGRDEVYVRPFPGPGGKIPISADGGNAPVWARSGREIFYRNGDKMMAVDIATEPGLAAGGPRPLFEGRFDPFGSLANFDVTPDGQRFVMIQEGPDSRTQFNVVLGKRGPMRVSRSATFAHLTLGLPLPARARHRRPCPNQVEESLHRTSVALARGDRPTSVSRSVHSA